MGIYEDKLREYLDNPSCVRLFHAPCPECGKKVWNVDEKFFPDKNCIKARFVCNCGNTFVHTVFSKKNGYKYRYPQGVVEHKDSPTKGRQTFIKQINAIYKLTEDGIKKKVIHNLD